MGDWQPCCCVMGALQALLPQPTQPRLSLHFPTAKVQICFVENQLDILDLVSPIENPRVSPGVPLLWMYIPPRLEPILEEGNREQPPTCNSLAQPMFIILPNCRHTKLRMFDEHSDIRMRCHQRAVQMSRQVVQLEHHQHPPRYSSQDVEYGENKAFLACDGVLDSLDFR